MARAGIEIQIYLDENFIWRQYTGNRSNSLNYADRLPHSRSIFNDMKVLDVYSMCIQFE